MKGECVFTTDIPLDKDGYPRMRFNKRLWRMNRLIFTFVHGEIPENKVIGHSCNNKACINPHHLYLTTSAENSTHAARDGLYKSGTEHGRAKRTKEEVTHIRWLYHVQGCSQESIAKMYGTSQSIISDIARYKSYKEIE